MWATSLLTIVLLFPLLSAAPFDIAGGVEDDNDGLHSHDENVTRQGKHFSHNEFDFSVNVEGDVDSIGHEVNIDVHSNTDDHRHHEDDAEIECKKELRVLFKKIDSNNNGIIDAKELLRVCHQNNFQVTESSAVRILTLPDNTVGFNLAKFCELLKDCPSTNRADLIYFLLDLYDKVTCPHKDDLSDVLLENHWRTQNQIKAMSENLQRNAVVAEVEKMTGHTIEDLQGRANAGDLGSLTAIAKMSGLLIKDSIKSSSDVETMEYSDLRNTLIVEASQRFLIEVSILQSMTDRQLLKTFCTGCEVHVGKSTSNTISATVTEGCVCPTVVNKGNWLGDGTYPNEFMVTQDGSSLQVQRTDSNIGWSMDLSFLCKQVLTCGAPATLLTTSPGGDMVLCKDETVSTCEKDFESLCPAGWNLCTPGQFNNRNDGWDYNWEDLNANYPVGVIYCYTRYGNSDRAAHYSIVHNPLLNTDQPLNCYWDSSRPGCDFYEEWDRQCDGKDSPALCCAPTSTCGDEEVQLEEDCDDGNDSNMDDCLNTCTWRNPSDNGHTVGTCPLV